MRRRIVIGIVTAASLGGSLSAHVAGALTRSQVPDADGGTHAGSGLAPPWAATMSRPDLRATLQASVMGQPVYERMGYRTVAEFTVWECRRA